MYDVSDRFLHQLTADRRASLLRSGRASSKRPFRRALGAGLARLGLVADATPRPRTRREHPELRDSLTGSTQSEPAGADVVIAPASACTSRLRRGAQKA